MMCREIWPQLSILLIILALQSLVCWLIQKFTIVQLLKVSMSSTLMIKHMKTQLILTDSSKSKSAWLTLTVKYLICTTPWWPWSLRFSMRDATWKIMDSKRLHIWILTSSHIRRHTSKNCTRTSKLKRNTLLNVNRKLNLWDRLCSWRWERNSLQLNSQSFTLLIWFLLESTRKYLKLLD